ncbi:MAG: hypothetical protein EOO43_23625, partial [Flavobacterium sp.]
MRVPISKKLVLLTAVSSLILVAESSAQSTETKYFKDVTTTNIPIDPEAHPLDVVLIDVNGDKHLDA